MQTNSCVYLIPVLVSKKSLANYVFLVVWKIAFKQNILAVNTAVIIQTDQLVLIDECSANVSKLCAIETGYASDQ